MSVVERCPNCGTTGVAPGECEACHEAQVRYFCANHSPGLWLDASTCPTCGARFDEPAGAASIPAPAIRVRTPAPPAATTGGRGRRERLLPDDRAELEAGVSRTPLWQTILGAVVRARSLPTRAAFDPRPPVESGRGGCLSRFVLLAVLLLVALAGAVFLVGQVLIRGW